MAGAARLTRSTVLRAKEIARLRRTDVLFFGFVSGKENHLLVGSSLSIPQMSFLEVVARCFAFWALRNACTMEYDRPDDI
jgi:hypothetical protein